MTEKNYFVNARRYDKDRLCRFIKEHPDVDIKKVLGIFSLQTGMKVSTLRIYLDELRDAGVLD